MGHADRFLRRFYIEKGMFGSLSLTFIFYRPPLPKQTKKTTNEVTSAGTQQVLARVTYGPVAAAPSSTHVRKSSPPSAASGVGVRGLPGLLFVESTAPKA